MIRAVLDTNILVSALVIKHGKPAQILGYAYTRKFQAILAEEIFAEARIALGYKHIQKRFHPTTTEIDEFLERVRAASLVVTITEIEKVILRDPDDDLILACAIKGAADYLVSGNNHLLDLGQYRQIQILTPSKFLEMLSALPETSKVSE